MDGVVAIAFAGMLITAVMIILAMACEKAHEKDQYHEGWMDRARLEEACEMSPDDEAVLREMKKAWKAYLRANCLYKKGDSGKVDFARNFKEFKDVVWDTTIRRKELGK